MTISDAFVIVFSPERLYNDWNFSLSHHR